MEENNLKISLALYIRLELNKTSKIAYWLSSKGEGRGLIPTWGAMLCA